MREKRPFSSIAILLATTQLFGPVALWAAEIERGVSVEATTQGLVTGLKGQATVTSQDAAKSARVLRFRDPVTIGDQVVTGPDANIEMLWRRYALVTAQEQSEMRITEDLSGLVIQLTKGTFRVAVAKSALKPEETVTLQTPTARAVTRGGLFQITVVPVKQESARAIPVAQFCELENVGVLEGQAQIDSSTRGGGLATIDAGQGVQVCGGQIGTPFVLSSEEAMAGTVLYAVAHHANTPESGTQHLAEQQMQQATALQLALLGASESETPETQAQRATQDAIISALNVPLGTSDGVTGSNAFRFGSGNPYDQAPQTPDNRTGTGYGPANSNGLETVAAKDIDPGISGGKGLLVFTEKIPIKAVWVDPTNESCLPSCTKEILENPNKVSTEKQTSVPSTFTAVKELLLVGGTPNVGHGGTAPTERLIVRGAELNANNNDVQNNVKIGFTDSSGTATFGPRASPADLRLEDFPLRSDFTKANSTFVVDTPSQGSDFDGNLLFVKDEEGKFVKDEKGNMVPVPCRFGSGASACAGGTLGQFSNRPDGVVVTELNTRGVSNVDAAITATGGSVNLTGGVILDRKTSVTIGETAATATYFSSLTSSDAKFNGSLVSVIKSPSGPVSLKIGDRALGVFDGSKISPCTPPACVGGNKALLSVLDAQLKGPDLVPPAPPVPLIDVDAAGGERPLVTVTSAVVVRSMIELKELDGALLVASAPLLALTNATMTTTSHFADLAGNQNPALTANVGNALVGLNAAKLVIENGNFLNLNAASATITGYLFSLNNGSTLDIKNGLLFSLTNGSSLTLNANAFGVFGDSGSTLSVANGLCGSGAVCGQLVNSATTPFLLPNGSAVKVAGISQNLVAPSNFSVFARQNPSVQPTINIGSNDALFKVDGTSTLTIKTPP